MVLYGYYAGRLYKELKLCYNPFISPWNSQKVQENIPVRIIIGAKKKQK